MVHLLKLLAIFSLLLVILSNASYTAFDSYYGFYYDDCPTEEMIAENPLANLGSRIAHSYPVQVFSNYTGFGTGYGFFAPNVASDFITLYQLEDDCGAVLQQINLPPFQDKESSIRYLSATGMFLEKVTKDSAQLGLQADFLNVLQGQMAAYVNRKIPACSSVTMDLYLYEYISLAEAPRAENFEGLLYIDSQTSLRP